MWVLEKGRCQEGTSQPRKRGRNVSVAWGAIGCAVRRSLAGGLWLHVKWEEYVELYGKRQSRVDLLNEAAPLFFRIVQDALWADTLLHIARLTDEPNSYDKPSMEAMTCCSRQLAPPPAENTYSISLMPV
ncbi:AbiU2 domain-containing protein [Vineibacter terrae]